MLLRYKLTEHETKSFIAKNIIYSPTDFIRISVNVCGFCSNIDFLKM